MKTTEKQKDIEERLDYLREEIKNERLSYDEILELRDLAKHIKEDDVRLLQWILEWVEVIEK